MHISTKKSLSSLIFILTLGSVGCVSKPSVLPRTSSLKVERVAPASKDCKDMGPVKGRIINKKAKPEEALEDLKMEAANLGANYLWVQQYSDSGTNVTGMAYLCE